MTNLLFLVVPAVIAALAVTFVWWRNRPETSPTSGIDRFSGQMAALAPDAESQLAGGPDDVGIRVQPVDGSPGVTDDEPEPLDPPPAEGA